MNIQINCETDIDEQIKKISELVKSIKELESNTKLINFTTIKQFCELSGWGKDTVKALYNRPDFPSCDFGKEKIAEANVIKKYFSVPRRKNK